MQQDVRNLIEQQKQQLSEWLEQTEELARYIANDVCDSIEAEVDEEASGGVIWDFMESFVSCLGLSVANTFDDVCEKWIVHRLEMLSEIIASAAGESWSFNGSSIILDGLREGYRLTHKMEVLFNATITKSQQSIFQLNGNFIREELTHELPDINAEMKKNGERLQEAFKQDRPLYLAEAEKAAAFVVRKAIGEYRMELLKYEAMITKQGGYYQE